ncbi:hypothetical protein B0H21DRAFT_532974 [Amylocystis lapponica]|nr:hypothetical protein B0H21DRAFT_532974 [Amylocystis lapponica]
MWVYQFGECLLFPVVDPFMRKRYVFLLTSDPSACLKPPSPIPSPAHCIRELMSADHLPNVLRVVTGHTSTGAAVVTSQHRIQAEDFLPGVRAGLIWSTDAVPTNDNNSDVDGATRIQDGDLGIGARNGAALRYTDLAPGTTAAMHRTSSLDYNVLIHGKLILILDDGAEKEFTTPGDVVIQRGTMHAWRNPGPEWTRWVTVVVDANPAVVGGQALPATFQT